METRHSTRFVVGRFGRCMPGHRSGPLRTGSRPFALLVGCAAAVSLAACDTSIEPSEGTLLEPPPASFAMGPPERADVMNQGGVGVYALDGAMVVRQANGLRMSMTMPTPEPDSYVYPAGTEAGHPEVFTLWAFIFNFPELCDGPCDGNDLGADAPAKGSVYNVGGHVASGNSLTISGRAGVGEPALAPPPLTPTPLVDPNGAEIHLAVTSHGALDPTTLPTEFRIPTGSPVCACWWVAVFPAP